MHTGEKKEKIIDEAKEKIIEKIDNDKITKKRIEKKERAMRNS